MKKSLMIIVIAISVFMASCTILLPQLRFSGVILLGESQRKTGLVTISVQPGWENPGKAYGRITGFYAEFRNTSNSPVYIVWEKSALKYNNSSYYPFVQGQSYENYSRPMNALIVPPHGIVRKYIYSSQQPYREAGKSGNWKLHPIDADRVELVFCVQSRDIEDYYTIEVR